MCIRGRVGSARTGSGAETSARVLRCRPAWSRVLTSILLVARFLLAGVDPPRQCIELPEARGVLAPLAVLHERGAGRILPRLADRVGDQAHRGDHHPVADLQVSERSEEHTSELQSLMRISYAVFCLKRQNKTQKQNQKDNRT